MWSMTHWNGGILARSLSSSTTHLIVGPTQSMVKYKAAVANNIPVVVFEWLRDSIEAGAVLSTVSYTLVSLIRWTVFSTLFRLNL